MTTKPMESAGGPAGAGQIRAVLDTIGSLWFAAVLMMLLLVGMASATVFESMHSTELALAFFYKSWWFVLLLALLAVNVLASLLVRFPYSKRQIGFVITHTGILVTLAGAAVTYYVGIDGQVGLAEGDTVDRFRVGEPVLTVVDQRENKWQRADLAGAGIGGYRTIDDPAIAPLRVGDLEIEVERYLPDGQWIQRVLTDTPGGGPAAQVSLSATGMDDATWVFARGSTEAGPATVSYQRFDSSDALEQALTAGAKPQAVVQVTLNEQRYEIPLDRFGNEPVEIGKTAYRLRLMRYLPHALVTANNQLENVSDRPVNPAVELELIGPGGAEPRVAFANFPDFGSRPGGAGDAPVEIQLLAPEAKADAEITLLSGPDGAMFVRFNVAGSAGDAQPVELGKPIESPWPGRHFEVLQLADRARTEWVVEPAEEIRETRQPMMLIGWRFGKESGESWIQKFRPVFFPERNGPYKITFADKELLLGFELKLNRFEMARYPGTMRPRSFESHVTITDPKTGERVDRVISMNNPTKYGGYTLFQSSYRMETGTTYSFLSVSRDVGLPIVYVGYFSMLCGMVIVLITRVGEHRRAARVTEQLGVGAAALGR